MNQYGVVLFNGTQAAIRAERVLTKAGRVVKLVPTPRHLSSDCGVALRFAWPEEPAVRKGLQASQVEYETIAVLD